MPDLQCIADRFALTDRSHAIDLATGATVTIAIVSAGARDEQAAWLQRCAERDDLLDYGLFGPSSRFEAFGSRPPYAGATTIVEGAIAELFETAFRVARVLRLFGPAGCGKSSAVLRLARQARLHGFVPFAVTLLGSPLAVVLEGRSVVLIDDEQDGRLRALADVALLSPRPHVLIQLSKHDAAGIPSLRLPEPVGIGKIRSGLRRRTVPVISRAAERAPVYGAASATMPWPVAGEVLALRDKVDRAVHHLNEGRHAPGERGLRQAIGGLTRRGEWASAAGGSLALAASLLKRGRPREAKAIVDAAREACRKAPGDRLLIAAATLSGVALTDLARLDEAETVLTAAQTVAAHADDHGALPGVALALARCRFWRGQYADAREALRLPPDTDLSDDVRVRADVLQARLAVGEDDVASAVSLAAEAQSRAEIVGRPGLRAEAACGAAFAHLAAGDLAALRQDVERSKAASGAARDPLRYVRAQMLLCEQLRRGGSRDDAARIFERVRRIPASALPRVIKCRRDLLEELLACDGDATLVAGIARRHISSSGLHALALLVPKAARTVKLSGGPSTPVEDAIEMLRVCQTAADEETTLALVCEQIQRQTQAAGAGFFGAEAGGLARLASRGSRLEAAVAQRAVDGGVFVAPHRIGACVEAAVPVRYGGQILGALAMRWVVASVPDAERVATAAAMAATAAAPILAAALAARRRGDGAACRDLLGLGDAMIEIRKAIDRAAAAPFAVLIEGESGSGKELVARAIHKGGIRRDRPFVTLNCAALPDDLVESELFGHARGAFTGAVGERLGVFEEASTGTLLLDEVGELSPRAQAKVLRVIQEGELRRVGENVSRRIDVRIVSATNRDLREEAAAGRFRLDLLYRLDVVRITVPPLRERREDIPTLVEHIWRDATARSGSHATLGAPVISALTRYEWPGNVRELQNVLASLAVRAGRRGVVPPSALPPVFQTAASAGALRLDAARRAFDANFVRAALVRCGGRRSRAAAELGLTRQGLAKLMSRLGMAGEALS